jgi:uncharacterized protein
MTLSDISFNEEELRKVCRENDIQTLSVFGSVARGENNEDSDVDLLAKFESPKSLFELIDIEENLSKIFGGKKTDLVTEAFLSPFIRDSIKKEAKTIFNNG